jgi:hypothetical protein
MLDNGPVFSDREVRADLALLRAKPTHGAFEISSCRVVPITASAGRLPKFGD